MFNIKKSVIIFLTTIATLSANEHIIWMSLEFPPSFISMGENANRGYSDVATEIAIAELKEYKNEKIFMNPPQAIAFLKEKPNVCGSGLNKNAEREGLMHFSSPFIKRFPNELVIRSAELAMFEKFIGHDGRIEFEKLIDDDTLKMGYHKDRSYSPKVDAILKAKERTNLIHRPAKDLTDGFLSMLETKRIDYIIESPDSLRYFVKKNNLKDLYKTVPIKDSDGMLPVYFACSKSELGAQVISKINKIIESNQEKFDAAYIYWLDSDSIARYKK